MPGTCQQHFWSGLDRQCRINKKPGALPRDELSVAVLAVVRGLGVRVSLRQTGSRTPSPWPCLRELNGVPLIETNGGGTITQYTRMRKPATEQRSQQKKKSSNGAETPFKKLIWLKHNMQSPTFAHTCNVYKHGYVMKPAFYFEICRSQIWVNIRP